MAVTSTPQSGGGAQDLVDAINKLAAPLGLVAAKQAVQYYSSRGALKADAQKAEKPKAKPRAKAQPKKAATAKKSGTTPKK